MSKVHIAIPDDVVDELYEFIFGNKTLEDIEKGYKVTETALTVINFLIKEMKNGKRIMSVGEDGTTTLLSIKEECNKIKEEELMENNKMESIFAGDFGCGGDVFDGFNVENTKDINLLFSYDEWLDSIAYVLFERNGKYYEVKHRYSDGNSLSSSMDFKTWEPKEVNIQELYYNLNNSKGKDHIFYSWNEPLKSKLLDYLKRNFDLN